MSSNITNVLNILGLGNNPKTQALKFRAEYQSLHRTTTLAVIQCCAIMRSLYVEHHGKIAFKQLVLTSFPVAPRKPENFNADNKEERANWDKTKRQYEVSLREAVLTQYRQLLPLVVRDDSFEIYGITQETSAEDVLLIAEMLMKHLGEHYSE